MSTDVLQRVRVEKNVVVRIYRAFTGKGLISVSKNQEVVPTDILGTVNISSGFRTLNLAQLLSVPPKDTQKYMKKTLGERVYKDELIAYKEEGLFKGKSVVLSPTDGLLDFFNPQTGEIRMSFTPKKKDLTAGVYGIVEGVDKERGQLIIRIQASLIHGMFGSGRVSDGILHVLGKRDELTGPGFIPPANNGQILVGGSLVFKEALSACISVGIKGFITGGINAADYKGMAGGHLIFPKKLENDIGISIIVCEGFGSAPIGEDIFNTLAGYNSRFVSVDGNTGTIVLPSFESKSMDLVRRTKLPPQENVSNLYEKESEIVQLSLGQKVRIVGNSFMGEQGKVVAVDATETKLASGVKAKIATIETSRRKIPVPVANLEIIL